MTPVRSGEDPVTLPAPQPQSPLVEVVEAASVALSSPSASQSEAGISLQWEPFDFSLEVPPAAPVVSVNIGLVQAMRHKRKVSLEIVVSSLASRLGTKDRPNIKSNKNTSNQAKSGGKSNKQANHGSSVQITLG